jgi:glyoxylase-like metal-dependent hydrolase (beta-lactamase superfamily II)
MRIDQPGNVTDKIVLLGRRESCVYLLKGQNEFALLGGGMVTIVPDMLKQIAAFKIDEHKIRRLIIQHSHFDHCGVIPFFKNRPWTVLRNRPGPGFACDPEGNPTIASLNAMLLKLNDMKDAAELNF